ncbi:hypothetical protein TSUD_31580 [Trifolium subterraneum]|uniref:Pre-mRNA-splicing factor Syf1-like N-terminal HAT-repeats domain-containing protein n=1 Tax=Trifolium subterraneum TaxID=3900 RepID=A0A2Z6MC00_TRISU|nr:hypothetical protein TSUD_31580 [Trifolium subterraneum]
MSSFTMVKLPRPTRVKNKIPAPIQITAEHIIHEARQLHEADVRKQKKTTFPNRVQKRAPDHVSKGRRDNEEDLYWRFLSFQKQYGDKKGIEYAITWRKRFEYEDEVKKNPFNYDSWFDYVRLEESVGNKERVREIYNRAVINVPPAEEKRYWQRYIYFWINYALYEELEAGDIEQTRDVYKECLKLIPHHKFTFSKVWLLAVQFEIRQSNLKGARKILGNAIGMAPKDKIFKNYIEMELQLAETWRARAIFDLAIGQPTLDMPELLWKAYIDFEVAECEFEKARVLYGRLLDRTKHLKDVVTLAMKSKVAFEDQVQPDAKHHLLGKGKEFSEEKTKRFENIDAVACSDGIAKPN